MTGFNKSIVEDAALEWFGALGYALGHGSHGVLGDQRLECAGPWIAAATILRMYASAPCCGTFIFTNRLADATSNSMAKNQAINNETGANPGFEATRSAHPRCFVTESAS